MRFSSKHKTIKFLLMVETEEKLVSVERATERVALVTGGTAGIGKATAVKLAQDGYKVVIVGRDVQRGEASVHDVKNRSKNTNVTFLQADMSLMREVQRLVDVFLQRYERLDVLIHSAGVIHIRRMLTEEGLESTFATDYLSRFLLTNRLLDLLKSSAPARVVNIAGAGSRMGRIDFDDLLGARLVGGMRGLGQAQFANDVFTVELARRHSDTALTFTVMHPGAVDTGIRREFPRFINTILGTLFKPFALTPEQGAEAPYYLATSSAVKSSGALFKRKQQIAPSKTTLDPQLGKKLWDVSEKLIYEALQESKS